MDLPSHKKDMISKTTLGLSSNKFFLIIPFMRYVSMGKENDHFGSGGDMVAMDIVAIVMVAMDAVAMSGR